MRAYKGKCARRASAKSRSVNALRGALMLTALYGMLATALAVVAFAMLGRHSAGTLDPSFGQGGIAIVQPNPACMRGCPIQAGSSAEALALTSDGGILLAGNGAGRGPFGEGGTWLARLDANGALDPSFGSGGFARDVPQFSISRVLIGVNGVVFCLVRGRDELGLAVERFTSAGVLDRSFGSQGIRWLVAPKEQVEMDVDGEGRIVVMSMQSGPRGITISRFLPSGGLDLTFGHGGVAYVHALGEAQPVRLAAQTDGGVVVVGSTSSVRSPAGGQFSMVRLTSSGKLDRSFGKQGVVRISKALDDGVDVVAVGPKQEILLISHGERIMRHGRRPEEALVAVRYTGKGALDRSFGVQGITRVAPAFAPRAVAFEANDDAIIVGKRSSHVIDAAVGVWELARYSANGLDCSFGRRGLIEGSRGNANTVAVQRNGRITVAGSTGLAPKVASYFGGGKARTCRGEGGSMRRGRR